MSRGAGYLGLMAELRQEELLGEVMRERRRTRVIARRPAKGVAWRLRALLRTPTH